MNFQTAALSRAHLMNWLASLGTPISRIEDVGKGVVMCRLLSSLDSTFPRNYIKEPIGETGFINNLTIVKGYLERQGVHPGPHLPIERMCKLKLQDNLEAIRWFYVYYNSRIPPSAEKPAVMPIQEAFLDDLSHSSEEGSPGSNCPWTELNKLKVKAAMLKKFARVFENERDFYYNKLVAVEQYVMGLKDEASIKKEKLLEIMYDGGYKRK